MGWFSRKKYVTHEEFNELMFTIRNSFANVKQDIANVKLRSQNSENYTKELQNIIGYMNQSMQNFDQKLNLLERPARQSRRVPREMEEVQEDSVEEESPNFRQRFSKGLEGGSLVATERIWEELTNVQKSLVLNLKKLQDESNSELISMKYLAQELYPKTDYSDIKAMISNYTDLLDELGFIEKKRKRRESFLTLTKKAINFLPKQKIRVKN